MTKMPKIKYSSKAHSYHVFDRHYSLDINWQ